MSTPRRTVNAGLASLILSPLTPTVPAAARSGLFAESFGRLPAWCLVPRDLDQSQPMLVAVHGISRDARAQINAFQSVAHGTGRIVIAPRFTNSRFNGYQRPGVDEQRADDALIGLIRILNQRYGLRTGAIDLFGFSGGAQFAHRFAMQYPNLIARLVVASAGWYTFPYEHRRYPYGLKTGENPGVDLISRLDPFLRLPILTLVGSRDNQRDATLRTGPRLDLEQGRHRLERARRWVQALHEAAQRRGIRPDVSLRLIAQCGHDFDRCAREGNLVNEVVQWLMRPGSASSQSDQNVDWPGINADT